MTAQFSERQAKFSEAKLVIEEDEDEVLSEVSRVDVEPALRPPTLALTLCDVVRIHSFEMPCGVMRGARRACVVWRTGSRCPSRAFTRGC
jgi:hypothetical protein